MNKNYEIDNENSTVTVCASEEERKEIAQFLLSNLESASLSDRSKEIVKEFAALLSGEMDITESDIFEPVTD